MISQFYGVSYANDSCWTQLIKKTMTKAKV